ncbi:MAG: Spy/CpxP family protein refolding chaperone [bacterium]
MSSTKTLAALMMILSMSAVALAQEPATSSTDRTMQSERMDRRERRGKERFGRHEEIGLMRGLELTEAQKQQQRAIVQRHLESIKEPREELLKLQEKRVAGTLAADDETRAKSLRKEIHSAMQSSRSEVEAILTVDQRAKLGQLKNARKVRHDEMRLRRAERSPEVPR